MTVGAQQNESSFLLSDWHSNAPSKVVCELLCPVLVKESCMCFGSDGGHMFAQTGRQDQPECAAELFFNFVETRRFRRVRAQSGSKLCSEVKPLKSWHDSTLCGK